MSSTDLKSLLIPESAKCADATVADGIATNGAEIDISTGSTWFLCLNLGAMGGDLLVAIQSSATSGSGYVAASPAITFTIADGADNTVQWIFINAIQATQLNRYCRATFTGDGGTVVTRASQGMFGPRQSLAAVDSGVYANANVQVYEGNPGA